MRKYMWACSILIILCVKPEIFFEGYVVLKWLWMLMLGIAILYDDGKDK